MNAATENNNELGISLLLGGVRGAVYIEWIGRGGLCLKLDLGDCVYVVGSV